MSPEAEWRKSNYPGCVERTTFGPVGQAITEIVDTRLRISRYFEEYPKGLRINTVLNDAGDLDEEDKKDRQTWFSFLKDDDTVKFYDFGENINTNVLFKDRLDWRGVYGDDPLVITFTESGFNSSKAAFVTLRYNAGRLAYCCAQPENPYDYSSVPQLEPTNETLVPDLINYIRTAPAEQIRDIREAGYILHQEFVSDHELDLQQLGIPDFIAATQVLTEESAAKFFPADLDMNSGIDVLDSIGWNHYLSLSLMEYCIKNNISSLQEIIAKKDDHSKISADIDALVTNCLESSLADIKPTDTIFSNPTWFDHFSDDWFAHLAKNDFKSLVEKSEVEDQVALLYYGSEIHVLDHTYKVERGDQWIFMTCSQNGKERWHTTFPLSLPSDVITKIHEDRSRDFRVIKWLLAADFSKAQG